MSGEIRQISFTVLVKDAEDLPPHSVTGEPRYADDVVSEIERTVSGALRDWYNGPGQEFLKCEPTL